MDLEEMLEKIRKSVVEVIIKRGSAYVSNPKPNNNIGGGLNGIVYFSQESNLLLTASRIKPEGKKELLSIESLGFLVSMLKAEFLFLNSIQEDKNDNKTIKILNELGFIYRTMEYRYLHYWNFIILG
eukprot:GHVP01028549.1.p1 GENE.GHVP01028549.1~~GHVP01028549.1.p1  ORF type:complete len:127 (-),score=22.20 GHVP01028549.1:105-485(-)